MASRYWRLASRYWRIAGVGWLGGPADGVMSGDEAMGSQIQDSLQEDPPSAYGGHGQEASATSGGREYNNRRPMIVLALDTTTRAGSVALTRDGVVLDVFVGDPARTHATRLPGDLLDCLRRQGLALADVDLFAVAAGPGSFTGLRIGIATIQGLAFANNRKVVAVSALEALAASGAGTVSPGPEGQVIGAWMDAQRHEIYAELYRVGTWGAPPDPDPDPGAAPHQGAAELEVVEPAAVGEPASIVEIWRPRLGEAARSRWLLMGDGALAYREIAVAGLPGVEVIEPVPPLAPAIAVIAGRRGAAGLAVSPHAVKPIYVRRPDAELARDRRLGQGPALPATPADDHSAGHPPPGAHE